MEEINNLAWSNEIIRTRLVNCLLKPVSDHIKSLDQDLIVSIAPYFSATQSTFEFNQWWVATLAQAPNIDVVMLQDGIGVDPNRSLDTVAEFLSALRSACDITGCSLWADIEIFDGITWLLRPFEGVIDQIEKEEPIVDKIVCFEWFYLTPTIRNRQPSLNVPESFYVDYKAYLNGLTNVSKGKSYTLSPSPSPSYPESDGELTDGVDSYDNDTQVGWFDVTFCEVTIDLLSERNARYGFMASMKRASSSGVSLPSSIEIEISTDNVNFTPLCLLTLVDSYDNTMVAYYQFTSENITARYIRFRMNSDGGWLVCSELSVYRYEPDNVALGKCYSLSPPPSESYPDSGQELTDGTKQFDLDSQVGWPDVSDISVIVDLGQIRTGYYGFTASFMSKSAWGVYLPALVHVSKSIDGVHFEPVGELVQLSSNPDDINTYELFLDDLLTFRAVRFDITTLGGWVMCNEVEVLRKGADVDTNQDGIIDILDLSEVASNWLLCNCCGLSDCASSDFDNDTQINMNDFVVLASNWLRHGEPEDDFAYKLKKAKTTQVDLGYYYYKNRSTESIVSELHVNGFDGVYIMVLSEDIIPSTLVQLLHDRGVSVSAMFFALGTYSESLLPPNWRDWLMEFTYDKPYQLEFISFVYDDWIEWWKQYLENFYNTYGFDGFTFVEVMYPVYDGITQDPVYYADVSPDFQQAFMDATGNTAFPNFDDPSDPHYFKTDTALYQDLVEFRVQALTNFYDEIVNGIGGLRETAPEVIISTWTLGVDIANAVEKLREWEGYDTELMVKTVKPDFHYIQTHWPDWCKTDLPSDYVLNYSSFINAARLADPFVDVGIQTDIGSTPEMRRSNQWYEEFLESCSQAGVTTTTYYEFQLRWEVYHEAPELKKSTASDSNTIKAYFDQWIHPASVTVMIGRELIDLRTGNIHTVTSVSVDGNILIIDIAEPVVTPVILEFPIGGIHDVPQVRYHNDAPMNTIPEGTVVRLNVTAE